MFGIGLPELILIMAVGLVVVGPDKLPELARSLAKGINELKKSMNSLKENIDKETEPWKETIQPALLEEIEKQDGNDDNPPPASGSEETFRAENADVNDTAPAGSHVAEDDALTPKDESVVVSVREQGDHEYDQDDDDFDDDDEYDEGYDDSRNLRIDETSQADGDTVEESTVIKEKETPRQEGDEKKPGRKAVEVPTNGR